MIPYQYSLKSIKHPANPNEDIFVHPHTNEPMFIYHKDAYSRSGQIKWHPYQKHVHGVDIDSTFEYGSKHNRKNREVDSKTTGLSKAKNIYEAAIKGNFKDKINHKIIKQTGTDSYARDQNQNLIPKEYNTYSFHDPDTDEEIISHHMTTVDTDKVLPRAKVNTEYLAKHGIDKDAFPAVPSDADNMSMYRAAVGIHALKGKPFNVIGLTHDKHGASTYKAGMPMTDEQLSKHHEDYVRSEMDKDSKYTHYVSGGPSENHVRNYAIIRTSPTSFFAKMDDKAPEHRRYDSDDSPTITHSNVHQGTLYTHTSKDEIHTKNTHKF